MDIIDELARVIDAEAATYVPATAWGEDIDMSDRGLTLADGSDMPLSIGKAVWEAGWRKMPSREILARELYVSDNAGVEDAGSHWDHGTVREWTIERVYRQADAILALMDGPTETGEK